MANVLEKIVKDKREEIALLKQARPLSTFIDQLKPSTNSFYAALAAAGVSYIFECKKASPSKGLIRENFDLAEISDAYSKEAACFSVLTDKKYFQGKFEYLQFVSKKVAQPTLNKDFFVEPYQVYFARHLGANAILLMLSVLSDEEYLALAKIAKEYHMDVLTEVSNEIETERALALGANIIGINNRNLRDLSTDLKMTELLAPIIRQDPRFNGVVISESGIYSHKDIVRLSPLVDGFLVGSALMAQDNLEQAINQLVYGQIKVCGISSLEQAKMLSKFPATYLGLIFAPNSKRFVSIETATEISQNIRHNFIGVFVDQPLELIVSYAHLLHLKAVQLHGQESQETIRQLRSLLPTQCEIWKVLAVENTADNSENAIEAAVTEYQTLLDEEIIAHILLDCKVGQQSGGTGVSFNWQLLDTIKDKSKLILAGGVSVNNILQACATDVPIIDVNSGVESEAGIKSQAKLEALFSQLRRPYTAK